MVQGGTESIPYPQPMTMPNYSNLMMDGYHSHTLYSPVRSPQQPIAKSHHPQPHMLYHATSSPRSSSSYSRRPAPMGHNYQVESHMPLTTATVAGMNAPAGPSLPPLSQLLPSTSAKTQMQQAIASDPMATPNAIVYSPPPHQAPHQAPPHADAYGEVPSAYLPLNDSYSQHTYNSPESASRAGGHGASARPGSVISSRASASPHSISTMNPDMIPIQGESNQMAAAAAMHPLQTVEGIYAYHPMMANTPNYDGSMMPMPMDEPPHSIVHNQERYSYDSSSTYSKRQKVFSFVSLPGINQPKRPRRRYDEIERLYSCNWQGCTKSYGTLNHLNAHVSMQKHVSYQNLL